MRITSQWIFKIFNNKCARQPHNKLAPTALRAVVNATAKLALFAFLSWHDQHAVLLTAPFLSPQSEMQRGQNWESQDWGFATD